jgi:hypothetical protein
MVALRTRLGALAALSLVASACASEISDAPPQTASSQAAAVAVEEAGAVDSVAAEGAVDVEITAGSEAQGRIECDAERMPQIHVETRGRTIHVWTDSPFDDPEDGTCLVRLGVAPLRALEVSGSGDVRVVGRADGLAEVQATGSGDLKIEELQAGAVHVAASGSGDIDLQKVSAGTLALEVSGSGGLRVGGTSERTKLLSSGSGDVRAGDLRGGEVAVLSSGSGDVWNTTSQKVSVDANGSGDVLVGGRPESRSVTKNGSGDIVFQ